MTAYSFDLAVNYVRGTGWRCDAAHPTTGFRCARLPGHRGRCVAILEAGQLSRFEFAPLPPAAVRQLPQAREEVAL